MNISSFLAAEKSTSDDLAGNSTFRTDSSASWLLTSFGMILSGHDGDDAHRYQEKQLNRALLEAKE